MRFALIDPSLINAALMCLIVSGCTQGDGLPKQPNAPTDAVSIDLLSKEIDRTDSRASAAIVVAKENLDKPKVVNAELGVASSYLKPPSESDVAFARQRAATADEKVYALNMEHGRKLVSLIDVNLVKIKADQQEAMRVSELKDKRIAELEQKCVDIANDSERKMWTIAGIAMTVMGGLIFWLLKDIKGSAMLIGIGLGFGAYPRVMDSVWFVAIADTAVAVCVFLLLWWLYDKVKDSIDGPNKD
jgi:hypothetical protein